jgi:hypothetical protein
VRRILISTRKLSGDVVRALHAFGAAHELELLELTISVQAVQANGHADEQDEVAVLPISRRIS